MGIMQRTGIFSRHNTFKATTEDKIAFVFNNFCEDSKAKTWRGKKRAVFAAIDNHVEQSVRYDYNEYMRRREKTASRIIQNHKWFRDFAIAPFDFGGEYYSFFHRAVSEKIAARLPKELSFYEFREQQLSDPVALTRHRRKAYAYLLSALRQYQRTIPSIADWRLYQTERHEFAEAKRAGNDPQFRPGYIRRTVRRLKGLLGMYPSESLSIYMQYQQSLTTDKNWLLNIRRQFDNLVTCLIIAGDVTSGLAARVKYGELFSFSRLYKIPCQVDKSYAPRMIWPDKWPQRGKDWTVNTTVKPSYLNYVESSTDWSRGSNRPRHNRTVNTWWIQFFAWKESLRVCRFVVHGNIWDCVLPAGYHWGEDSLGFCLIRDSDGFAYHPDADAIWLAMTESTRSRHVDANLLISRLNTHYRIQQDRATRDNPLLALPEAERDDIWVCYSDSLKAGNCAAGTNTWLEKVEIDTRKTRHIKASTLFRMAGKISGYRQNVMRTINRAIIRHQDEMARGWCSLSYHSIVKMHPERNTEIPAA